MKCLAKDAAMRYQSALTLRQECEDMLTLLTGEEVVDVAPRASNPGPAKPRLDTDLDLDPELD